MPTPLRDSQYVAFPVRTLTVNVDLCPMLTSRTAPAPSHPTPTLSEMRLVSCTRPSPPHLPQGTKDCPEPWQVGHTATCWKVPSGVRSACTIWPVPWHCMHVVGLVPLRMPVESHSCTHTPPGEAGYQAVSSGGEESALVHAPCKLQNKHLMEPQGQIMHPSQSTAPVG